MQQVLLDRRIGGHAEGELSLRSNEAARALDGPAAYLLNTIMFLPIVGSLFGLRQSS